MTDNKYPPSVLSDSSYILEYAHECGVKCCRCGNDSFSNVRITDSGKSFDGEVTTHWFEGYVECSRCGEHNYVSDSG